MPSTFILRYPAGGSPTHSWQPSVDPLIGSGWTTNSGIGAEAMADQLTIYSYRYSDKWRVYRYDFELPIADWDAFETWEATVDGAAFEFQEGTCGVIQAYRKVKFADEGFQRQLRYVLGGSQTTDKRLAGTLVFRDSD